MERRDFIRTASLVAAGGLLGNNAGGAEPVAAQASAAPASPKSFDRVQFHNVQALTPADDGDGWRLCRVPAGLEEKLNPNARKRAYSTAGCEIRFNLKGDEARVTLKFVETRGEASKWLAVLADVFHGDYQAGSTVVRGEWTEIAIQRPSDELQKKGAEGRIFDPTLVRVLLPSHTEVRVKSIMGDVSPPRPGQAPARRYLAYGSSITNGFVASQPCDAYPARLSRLLAVDSLNLGLGGGAHLEPEMADFIGGRDDWDFASLELGINLIGGRRTAEEFRSRVANFLPRLAARRPDKWIFCTDIFTCMHDFRGNPMVTDYRRIVREAVEAIASPRLVHLDGRTLLTDPRGLSTDLLHPVSEGFAEIAVRLAAAMKLSML